MFDLITMKDLYNVEETEVIQLQLDSSYDLMPRSNVDSVIESVIAQSSTDQRPSVVVQPVPDAGQSNEELQPEPELRSEADENVQLWCICRKPSFGDMIGCDNVLSCKLEWYHFPCVNIRKAPKGSGSVPSAGQKHQQRENLSLRMTVKKTFQRNQKLKKQNV